MRAVKEYSSSRMPAGTRLEWRPMDGEGNFPLHAISGRDSRILFRLSKGTLVRCARSEEEWKDVRALVDQTTRLAA